MKTEKHSYMLVRQGGYNPFFFTEDGYLIGEISKINLFKKGEDGVKYSTKWFDAMRKRIDGTAIDVEKYPISNNNGFKSVVLDYDKIPLCRVIKFDNHDAFVCKSSDPDNKGTYELYLNIDTLHNFTATEIRNKPYTSRELRNETRVTFTIKGNPADRRYAKPAMNEEDEATAIFYCNHSFTDTRYGMFCRKIAEQLSCKMLDKKYSTIEVDSLIKDGVIDEIAKTIAELRKEFPIENHSPE